MRRAFALGLLVLACLVLPSAGRATTLNELKVGVRVVDFMLDPPHGRTALAVLYDPQNKASVDDAQTILGWLNSGIELGKVDFAPMLVDVRQLDDARAVRVAILAAGTEPYYNRIFDFARINHTLTISSDLSCVHTGKCAVGVSSTPRIEVVISHSATQSSGISFVEAFRMMVTEN